MNANARKRWIPASMAPTMEALQARWRTLPPKEQSAVRLALVAVAAFLVFAVGMRPAWRAVHALPPQIDRLDLQLQTMGRLAAESQALRQLPPVQASGAAQALNAATERLGPNARLTLLGDRATLALNGVPGDALAAWLREARIAARARPTDAQLTRNPQGYAGTIALSLGGTP